MREPETYWSRKGPAIPEVSDLPDGGCKGNESGWDSLSPGMRREIWRDAIQREARARQLPDDVLSRLRSATISGGLSTLDDYLMLFERQDAAREVIREDAERLARADEMHRKSEVQIGAREAV
ncbi:hypothetical protein IHQ56_14310 [Methylobacillus flagellatus]|nr:hypothetical protein [Methylobacillus flagellatus]